MGYVTIVYRKVVFMVIKENFNGCEVRIFFKPQAEDIKDKVLWLILECFKSRLKNEMNSD